MGCDIHAFIEYQDLGSSYWHSFGRDMGLSRNYCMFGLLAGVRGTDAPVYKLRGVPDDMGFWAKDAYWLYISENSGEGMCTPERAKGYAKYGSVYSEDLKSISHPDWHSHSWLTVDEFKRVMDEYRAMYMQHRAIEYEATRAAMEELSKHGPVRLVFWFDN